MDSQCLLFLLLIPGLAFSHEYDDQDKTKIAEKENEGDSQNKFPIPDTLQLHNNPTQRNGINIQSNSSELCNKTSTNATATDLELRGSNHECHMRDKYQHKSPTVSPANSSHVWVSWSWDWFHIRTHCGVLDLGICYEACDTNGRVTVVVNKKPQDIQLRNQTQSIALVRADPCLKHDIKMQVSDSEGTAVTAYNTKLDESLYSWRVSQSICLNNDNITVKILEPIEPLRNCIITRGDQDFKKTSATTGLVNLTIVNPNSNHDQPEKINVTITVSVMEMKRCKNEEDNEVDQTTTETTTIQTTIQNTTQTSKGGIQPSLILISGGTLCRNNRRLIGTPLIVIARQYQKNRD